MNLFKFIDIKVFIVSLAVGLFFAYINSPKMEIIYVYPNPDNTNKILYKDNSELCHQFVSKKMQCPSDKSLIRKYPVQIKKNKS